jgi:hypothetical protein
MGVIRAFASIALFALLAYYVWRRLVRDTGLRGRWRIAATIAIGLMVAPIIVARFLGSGGPPMIQGTVAWPTFLGWAIFALSVSLQQGGLLAGRYQIGPTQLYVSRGAGHWGPPVRFGAPAELTRVILRAGAAAG